MNVGTTLAHPRYGKGTVIERQKKGVLVDFAKEKEIFIPINKAYAMRGMATTLHYATKGKR